MEALWDELNERNKKLGEGLEFLNNQFEVSNKKIEVITTKQ